MLYDVIIVGNGVLGKSLAIALSELDSKIKIAVIGPKEQHFSASAAAGAMLNSFGEVTQATFSSKQHRYKLELSIQSSQLWKDWATLLNSHLVKSQQVTLGKGTYILLNAADEIDDANYAAIIAALDEYKQSYEFINPADISGLSPEAEKRPLRAVYIPSEGFIDSARLLICLTLLCEKNPQIELIDEKILSIENKDNKTALTLASKKTLLSENVVIAAGAASQQYLDQFESLRYKIPPLVYGNGTAFRVVGADIPINSVLRTPNRGLACGIHVVPRENNELYIGASNFVSPNPAQYPKMMGIAFLLQAAMEQINREFSHKEIKHWYLGHRPITVDTFPLIGKTSVPGVWVLSGTYRDGLHNSPLFAQSLAREILGKKPLFENKFFMPERAPIVTMSKEVAIKTAIKHFMSGAYQHELHMPKIGRWFEAMTEEAFYHHLQKLYEKLEIDVGLPPEIMIMYYFNQETYLPYIKKYYQHQMDIKNK